MDCVEDLKTSLCGHSFPELLLLFSLDQYLFDFSDHEISDFTPLCIDIFRLVLRLVILGLVGDYDKNWHVTAFLFAYSWPQTLVWYIFTWI